MVEGMGAIPFSGGVAFRVWAPHAERVWVTGDFNAWSDTADELASEGNGHWYGEVSKAAPGQEYKFVLKNGEQLLHRIDPYALQVTSSVGNGVIYDHGAFDWQGDDFAIPHHHELVIYEMHVGSFYRRRDDEVGTLELALEKLDHLLKLGVNAVQLMPLAEFAGDLSWGYNPAHIFAVESGYGGPDALKTFVREAHSRGLAVIQDVVYNHFGPSDLDLWRFDGWSENDLGGIYFYNDHRANTPWGDTRPDYGREEVRRFIHSNAMMWLHDYHLDGLRYDMTPYIRSVDATGRDLAEGWDLMRWINLSVREQFPGRITIAEDMHRNPTITQVEDHGAAFHAQWDGAFVHPVREAVIASEDAWRSMASIREAVETIYNGDAFQRVVYTESHDEVANGQARVPHEIDEGDPTGWYAQKRSTAGAALALTSPGIPMLFQGQEFLQGGWFRDDVPLDWDQNREYRGVVRLYRDLIRLRRNLDGTTKGLTGQHVNVFHADEENNVLAFHRWADGGPDDDTVVVVNLSSVSYEHYRIGMPHAGRWILRLNSDSQSYSEDFAGEEAYDMDAHPQSEDDLDAHISLSIAPYTVLIYSRAA